MLVVDIPGWGEMRWQYLLLDVNGTLAVDGTLVDGVADRVRLLADALDVRLITANTLGRAVAHAETLGVTCHQIMPGNEAASKRDLALHLGPNRCIAIGNGNNDALMLRQVSLGIAILGDEGLAASALQTADLVAPSILVALDSLLNPSRLAATLRR